jgi:RHS repeat-associated protein
VSVGGRPGFVVARSYNSQAAVEATEHGPWGFGWSGPYSAHLATSKEAETTTVTQDTGSEVVFKGLSGTFAPEAWIQATLTETSKKYTYTLPDQSKLEFNSEGELTKETERNGNSLTFAYNTSKELETVTDPASRVLTLKYNGEGEVKSVTDPADHVVEYEYESGNLKTVKVEGKERWKFEYNGEHELTKMTDGRGHTTETSYNTSHQVSSQKDPLGRERKWAYTTLGEGSETKITEPNGSETIEIFNDGGEPTKITRANGTSLKSVTENEYNSSFDKTLEVNPDGHSTKFTYDGENDKLSETDPDGDEKQWTYDGTHDVVTETTPKGEVTTIKRNGDHEPEVIERAAPGGKVQKTLYMYTTKDELAEEVNPLEGTTKYTYDEVGDKVSETNPDSDKRSWEYNKDSQEIAEVSPRGNATGETAKFTTTTERDEQGYPLKVVNPLGETTKYGYDGNYDLETEVDPNGHTIKYVHDADDELAKVEEADGDTQETGYDSEGQVTSRKDGNGQTWKYERNKLEEITEEINPLGQTTKRTYDAAGNLKTLEDPLKRTTSYAYDPGNRVTEVGYSSGTPSTVKYEYNKDSNVTQMTDGTGTTKNAYDELDRLSESVDGAGKTVKYEYNLANQPVKITYPNEKAVNRGYDKAERLEHVVDWNSQTTKFSYDPDGDLTATTFPSGTGDVDEYAYNNADEVSEEKMLKGTTKLATLAYERDNDGQITNTTTTGLPEPNTAKDKYDESNRLTEYHGTTFKYDPANNPTEIEGSGTYKYNNADELTEGPSVKYTFNEDDQRTKTEPTGEPTTKYSYDQAGNVTGVERAKSTLKAEVNDTFTYDGNNLRQSQTINGTLKHLTWDTAEPIPIILTEETNNYIYGPEDLPIEQINASNETLYYHHDQQGSTRLLTNTTGEKEASYTFNPYGTLTHSTGTAPTPPLLYDAQYTNTDTGLIYLHARTYDPETAQFLSVDPALETTGEPYTYTKDNPENSSDASGEEECHVEYEAEPIALRKGEKPPPPKPPKLVCKGKAEEPPCIEPIALRVGEKPGGYCTGRSEPVAPSPAPPPPVYVPPREAYGGCGEGASETYGRVGPHPGLIPRPEPLDLSRRGSR